jgi:hypothetical protein
MDRIHERLYALAAQSEPDAAEELTACGDAARDMLDALLKADAWVAQYHDTPGHDAASRSMSALLRKVIARAEGLS